MTHPCVTSYDAPLKLLGQICALFVLPLCPLIGHKWTETGHRWRTRASNYEHQTDFGDSMALPEKTPTGAWVQTERAAHEAWAMLIAKAPKAAQLMHILTARLGDHNAVVISQKTLMQLMSTSRRTVQRAIAVLVDERWLEIRQIGDRGTVNAYIVNDRVAWTGKRNGIRYSLFSATVIISDKEQPDLTELENQAPLRPLPSLYRDEQQLPSGDGLPPPSEPALPGMETDLPSKNKGVEGGK